jgi:2-octaprenylphenol hydroxylase
MKTNYDIVIVGGGMVGAALACALGGSEFKVAVLESRAVREPPADDYDLRVSAITLASRAFFENVGAWQGIARRRYARVAAMCVWDESGSGRIGFDAAEIGEPELAYIIENSVIQAALAERLQRFTNVHWLCPVEIADILPDEEPEVRLADGRGLGARLLVGADGAGSRVRAAAGIERQRHDLRQTSIVATVRTELPHEHIARQRFLVTGPLAFLPLPEARTCSIVWSAETAHAEELLALNDAAFTAGLQQAFGDSLGRVEQVGRRAGFPLALSHAEGYVRERLALCGDAAHTVHPLAGQGVNLGFLDAAQLAETLREAAERKQDIGSMRVLRRYERARKADNLAMVALTGGFRYLFSNRLPVVTELRNLGLNLTDAATPLKNLLIRRAAGLAGELPPLARRGLGA